MSNNNIIYSFIQLYDIIIVGDSVSNLYNKGYIDTVSSNILLDMVEGRKTLPNISNLEDRQFYVVLQHYLIKYLEENGKTSNVKKLLIKFYTDFLNYPYLFINSPLLKNDFLNRFVVQKSRNKIITFRDNYFNYSKSVKIYDEIKRKKEISPALKNRFYANMIIALKRNYKGIYDNEMYKEIAKYILNNNSDIKSMNEMELLYYCNYAAAVEALETKAFPEIHIMSNKPSNGGFQSDRLVFLNKNSDFTSELFEMTEVVCHETRHFYQQKSLGKDKDKAGFEMAIRRLFQKYLSTTKYDSYHRNYRYSGIELDAEKYGFYYGSRVLYDLDRKDLFNKLLILKDRRYAKRHFYEYMVDENNKKFPIDKFIVDNMDEIISKHPEELDKFQVLNSIYNRDGSRISLKDMITSENVFQARKIYDNYIYNEIANDGLDNIKLDEMNRSEQINFFKSLSEVYRDKTLLFLDYCKDKDFNNYNIDQITKTTKYQLFIINEILGFALKNIDILMNLREDKLTNRSFIFQYIYDLRDFNSNNINNKTIKESEELKIPISKVMDKINKFIYEFNKVYIEDRIKDFSIEELNREITLDDGMVITINDYLFNIILPKLDGHMEFTSNGKKEYIGDIIRSFKEYGRNR